MKHKKKKGHEGEIKLERVLPYDWNKRQVWLFQHGLIEAKTISREELEKMYPKVQIQERLR